MPVGFIGGDENSSETPSASTHFKRKKSKKNDVDHHPVTCSLTSLGNESIFIGSYNLLYSDFTRRENELCDAAGSSGLLHIEGGPSHVEEVLATNEGQTIEEQMAQLTAILQQKEDELVVLRQQTTVLQQQEDELVTLHRQAAMSQQRENELAALHQQVGASNERQRNEVNAAMSQNSYQSASATIRLEAIQRMIAKGVKAQYMQTHYSMWPGYVKPYPPEVDMVPFPSNYW
jgi:hypothetical protein